MTRDFNSLGDFSKFLAAAVSEERLMRARKVALELAAKIIEKEAKRVIGTYDLAYGWDQLADSTQAERVRLGFPANEPLLRTGEMRDSIEHTVHAERGEADIGSNSDIAVYQELGTDRIPARPFLAGAGAQKGQEAAEIIGAALAAAIAGASIEAEIIRLARDAARDIGRTGKEIANDDTEQ